MKPESDAGVEVEAVKPSIPMPDDSQDDSAKPGEPPQAPQQGVLREYFHTIVVCTLFTLFGTTFVVHPMTVPTASMDPTIWVGDRLLIDKFTYRNGFRQGSPLAPSRRVERGDVVVFKLPENPSVLYVKRVIGLPGERLQVRDKTVFIDGRALDEPYKHHSDPEVRAAPGIHGLSGRDNFGPLIIPPDRYFVMGDNRDDSRDSRYFGLLDRRLIVGRPLLVFWSYPDRANADGPGGALETLQLYAERIVFFFPRTRWRRIGRMVR